MTAAQGDEAHALSWYLRGCLLRDGRACYLAGLRLVARPDGDGSKRKQYLENARRSFVQACDLNEYDGCAMAAALVERTTESAAGILASYDAACAQGSGLGCYLAGTSYLEGWGIQDRQEAVTLLERGCHATPSVLEACDELRLIQDRSHRAPETAGALGDAGPDSTALEGDAATSQ
jgi:hypothetical protein